MEFLLQHKNWIIASIAILLIGFIGLALYEKASKDYHDTVEFLIPIKPKK